MQYYIDERTFSFIKKGRPFSVLVTLTPPSPRIPKAITTICIPAFNSFSKMHYKVEQFAYKFYSLKKCKPKKIEVEFLYEIWNCSLIISQTTSGSLLFVPIKTTLPLLALPLYTASPFLTKRVLPLLVSLFLSTKLLWKQITLISSLPLLPYLLLLHSNLTRSLLLKLNLLKVLLRLFTIFYSLIEIVNSINSLSAKALAKVLLLYPGLLMSSKKNNTSPSLCSKAKPTTLLFNLFNLLLLNQICFKTLNTDLVYSFL